MTNGNNSPTHPGYWFGKFQQPLASVGRGFKGLLALIGLAALLVLFIWFFCRIEPEPGELAILIHKTGQDLPEGAILALEPDQKGIQLEVLPEGRYFRNPYSWSWRIVRITDIPAGKSGVLTRLYGRDPAPGKILAQPDTKGIVAEVLRPGKYRINPYAYAVELFDAIAIRPGHVGVVATLEGQDTLSDELPPEARNAYLVGEGIKGVVPQVLDPGTYYLNPYLYNVVEVNLQSQRFIMGGEDSISFLTLDGFRVTVEGTIEFSIERGQAALLTHQIGDMDDVLKKLVLPQVRGFCRIEGSKHPAINFIVGETRQQFQDNLEEHLRRNASPWGIAIKSVLIRNIVPPDAIASIIRERELSVQNARLYEQQREQARSLAELTRQEMLAQQNKEKVAAETARIQALIRAQQELSVKLTAATRELEVAKLENAAAAAQAQAILAEAQANRDVIAWQNKAQAEVLGTQIQAFKGGINLARYAFYQKLGPRIVTILGSDEPNSLGGLLLPYLPQVREVQP